MMLCFLVKWNTWLAYGVVNCNCNYFKQAFSNIGILWTAQGDYIRIDWLSCVLVMVNNSIYISIIEKIYQTPVIMYIYYVYL